MCSSLIHAAHSFCVCEWCFSVFVDDVCELCDLESVNEILPRSSWRVYFKSR